jgi:MFS family permease
MKRAADSASDERAPVAIRRNFGWAAANGALFEFGASFADPGTVVAAFLGRLTPSPVAVGAAAAIARFGWLLPQLFAANYAQGLRHRKPIYLVGGWGRAFCLGTLALAFLLPTPLRDPPAAALSTFFVFWTAFSFVSGLAGAPYNDVIARTIPSGVRSRLLATRLFTGGALAAGAGLIVRTILLESSDSSLQPYALIFGMGAILLAISTACFAMIHEPPAPVSGARPSFGGFVRDGSRVVRRDSRFRRFVYVQLLAGVTKMVLPFYIVQARSLSGVAEAEVRTLLAAQALGGLALNPLWGWWGDRRGSLSLLKLLALVSGIGPTLAIVVAAVPNVSPPTTLAAYIFIFFLAGAATSGDVVADLTYLMEIAPDDRRPEYSGYMNALVAPSRLLPFASGLLLATVSFHFLFGIAALARWAVLARLERPGPATAVPAAAAEARR